MCAITSVSVVHSVTSDSFSTPWTVACQAPLSMRFPRQEHWSGLPFSSPGDLPDPGSKPGSPALAGRFFTIEPPEKPTRLFPSSQLLPTFNEVRKAGKADCVFLFFTSTYLTRNSCVGCGGEGLGEDDRGSQGNHHSTSLFTIFSILRALSYFLFLLLSLLSFPPASLLLLLLFLLPHLPFQISFS